MYSRIVSVSRSWWLPDIFLRVTSNFINTSRRPRSPSAFPPHPQRSNVRKIDAMYLYTDGGKEVLGDISDTQMQTTIAAALATTNEAMTNSDIDLEISPVYIGLVSLNSSDLSPLRFKMLTRASQSIVISSVVFLPVKGGANRSVKNTRALRLCLISSQRMAKHIIRIPFSCSRNILARSSPTTRPPPLLRPSSILSRKTKTSPK